MTFQEAIKAFEFYDRTLQSSRVNEAIAEIATVRGVRFSRQAVKPLLNLAEELMRPLDEATFRSRCAEIDDLKMRVGHNVSTSWLEERIFWFQQWRARRRTEIQQRRQRLERILSQLWVPATAAVPYDLMGGVGFHRRDIGGRILRWEEAEEAGHNHVDRCWVDQADERWLLEEVIGRLPLDSSESFGRAYQAIQRRACEFLWEAYRYQDAVAHGDGVRVLLEDFEASRTGGSPLLGTDEHKEHAAYPLDEPIRLGEEVEAFKDDLRRAIEESGDSVIGGTG